MKNIFNSTGHLLKFDNIVRADNCTLFDANGIRYLDLESGIWCTSIGHCHPNITRVIAEQAGKIIHSGYCYLNPVVSSTAEKLLEITGIKSGKCVFLCSGSEAVEYAVKVVKSISDSKYLLTMKNCYLSAYGISGERSENHWIHFDWKNGQKIEDIDFNQIAAFVFEPGSSQGLVHFPPADLIIEIVKRVRENGGIIIANEVTTGMGRTGEWFGYNHYNFIPDVVAIGKGLGNGYPVSSVVISDSVLNRINLHDFHYAQSHQNDPLGAAVAQEVIDVIESQNLLYRCSKIGEQIRDRLKKIQLQYGIIKDVRGRGLMIAVEFESNEEFSYAERINEELLKFHIFLVKRPGFEVFRIDPALTITDIELDYFLINFECIISGMSKHSAVNIYNNAKSSTYPVIRSGKRARRP